MKATCFIICISLLVQTIGLSQISKFNLPAYRPLRCGYLNKIRAADTITPYYINPIAGVRIYSCNPEDDSVFSISKGKVLGVEKIDDEIVCMIKYINTVYAYNNLSYSPLKKGSSINKGGYIGKLYNGGKEKNVRIVIVKNGKALSYNKHLFLLSHNNRIP